MIFFFSELLLSNQRVPSRPASYRSPSPSPLRWACVRADGREEETDPLARRTGRLVIKSRINEGLQPGSFENTCVSSGSDVSYYGERKHFESLGPAGATTGGDCPIEGPTVKARMGGSSLRASGFCHANHLYDRDTLRRQHSCGPSVASKDSQWEGLSCGPLAFAMRTISTIESLYGGSIHVGRHLWL